MALPNVQNGRAGRVNIVQRAYQLSRQNIELEQLTFSKTNQQP